MLGIDFCKFPRVARVDGLPLVPIDGGESGQMRNGFSKAKRPTQGIATGGLVVANLGWPTARLG